MPKKILVIDDEELITRTLVKALEKDGYDVLVAKRTDDAIAMVEEENFDLIISDIRMPGLNGVEAVKSVLNAMSRRGVQETPAIFITGYADESVEKEAQALAPQAYLYKPFDYAHLMNQVKEALKGRG